MTDKPQSLREAWLQENYLELLRLQERTQAVAEHVDNSLNAFNDNFNGSIDRLDTAWKNFIAETHQHADTLVSEAVSKAIKQAHTHVVQLTANTVKDLTPKTADSSPSLLVPVVASALLSSVFTALLMAWLI